VEDLVSRQDDKEDEDDQFTFRKAETKMPSSDLQDGQEEIPEEEEKMGTY
jgi:hypothetical protein